MHGVTEQGVMHVTTHGGELVPFDQPGPMPMAKPGADEVVMASHRFYFKGPASEASMALAIALAGTLIDRDPSDQGPSFRAFLRGGGKHRRGFRG